MKIDLVYMNNSNGFLEDNLDMPPKYIWAIRKGILATKSHVNKYLVSYKEPIGLARAKFKYHYRDMFLTPKDLVAAKGIENEANLSKAFYLFGSINKIKEHNDKLDKEVNVMSFKLPLDAHKGYFYTCCIFKIAYNDESNRMYLVHHGDIIWNKDANSNHFVKSSCCCAPVNTIANLLKRNYKESNISRRKYYVKLDLKRI